MERIKYSEDFKRTMVQKLVMPGAPGITSFAKLHGIHYANLKRWKDKYVNEVVMNTSKKSALNWPPEKKLQALIETSSMDEHQLGEYLRKNGLHSTNLDDWKNEFLSSSKASSGRPKKDPEVFELRKDKKSLEKNIRRKDKALAEMSARIILLKKSHEIWGTEEDEE